MAHRARCREGARVIPTVPDSTAAAERAVDGTRDANRKTADARNEGAPVLCFREEMDVVGLHAELDDAEISTRRGGESVSHRGEDTACTETTESVYGPQRDVYGVRGDMR
jgi:hypothetical protein